MPESRKTRLIDSSFWTGAALGIIVGLLLGGNNTLKIIITGQGSVGCAEAGEWCNRKPCCIDPSGRDRGEES